MGYNRQKIMRKILILLLSLWSCIINAQIYDKVIGAARYNCGLSSNSSIPLYTTTSSCQLTLNIYKAERYYDSYAKSTEYPITTWGADYNNGVLQSVNKVGSDTIYYFYYDNDNIIWQTKAYRKSTGQLIMDKNIYDSHRGHSGYNNFDIIGHEKLGFYKNGRYYCVYAKCKSLDNHGMYISYILVGGNNDKYFFSDGSKRNRGRWAYRDWRWLVSQFGLTWQKRSMSLLLERICNDDIDCSTEIYDVNCAGLIVTNGMPYSCAESLSSIIRTYNGVEYLYEYIWTY